MSNEKRRFQRYLSQSGAFVEFDDDFDNIIGTIVDIHREGLAFSYLSESQLSVIPRQFIAASLYLPENGLCLDDIMCRITYHIKLPASVEGLAFSKQCGVSFGDLDEQHRTELEYFLDCLVRRENG
ncbi:MAG: hypothetical protein GY868_19440 [Deltaproteobacteria bacterium]|nr:hypothetical protein [Deltaproteobacteria bacterium]